MTRTIRPTKTDRDGNPIDFDTPRVLVVRAGDGMQLGTMPAAVGMQTGLGKVARVNEKSFTTTGGDRIANHGGAIILLREARAHGWPKAAGCNEIKVKS